MRHWFLTGLGLLLVAGTVWASTTTKLLLGTTTTVLQICPDPCPITGLLSGAKTAASAAHDNTIGGGEGDGYLLCRVEGVMTFGGTPQVGSAVGVYFAGTTDGTNFDTCGLGTPQAKLPVDSTAGVTTTRSGVLIDCPPRKYKVCVFNDGTGQNLTNADFKVLYYTPAGY